MFLCFKLAPIVSYEKKKLQILPSNKTTKRGGGGQKSPILRRHSLWKAPKGQLISKCPFGIIVWTKIPTELFLDFCPEIFCTFLGASWKLYGASCRLPCL